MNPERVSPSISAASAADRNSSFTRSGGKVEVLAAVFTDALPLIFMALSFCITSAMQYRPRQIKMQVELNESGSNYFSASKIYRPQPLSHCELRGWDTTETVSYTHL